MLAGLGLLLLAASQPLLTTGFEDGLAGWDQAGPADFAVDTTLVHSGAQSARVTIAPGAELKWQQLRRVVGPAAPGDEFRVTLWVRSRDLADGSGAYAALEFLNAAGERCGILHTAVNRDNGSRDWLRLLADGVAPKETQSARVNLVLNSHGSAWFDDVLVERTGRQEPWPDLGDTPRRVTVTDEVSQPHFAGVGFHVFDHSFPATQDELDTVILKRWRELNPSFARLNHQFAWDRAKLDDVARWLRWFQETGTELYLTTWDPKPTAPGPERAAYARAVVDQLAYLVKDRGCTNIRWYCMSNELSLKGWGLMHDDLPTFGDYHRELHKALAAAGLPLGLLATDASPVSYWDSLEWAAAHLDDVTAIYGGHHYFTEHLPADERFYPWFAGKLDGAVKLARGKGKEFILGEFGAKMDGRTIDGKKRDVCVWFDTPTEPLVTLQLADAVLGALNAGVYGLGYWTYMDFPDNYAKGYLNKWGTFKREANGDFSTRDIYYGYGLLTRFCRGPAKVYRVASADPWVRAGALAHAAGTSTVVVLNRSERAVPLDLSLGALPVDKPFRRYVYDPAHVPQHPFGDLQPPTGTLRPVDGRLTDTLGPRCLVVYTTAYHEGAPPAVAGLTLTGQRLTWQPSPAPDLCYYRVFAGERQLGSTVATHFDLRGAAPGATYQVVAVDQAGNASPR